MKILFAAGDVSPFSKAGGLSDVVGSLPKALEKDAEIEIFTPLHGCIDYNRWGLRELENSQKWITFGGRPMKFRLFMTKLPETNINVFFVHSDWYFTCFKEVYPKWLDTRYEHERYIAFSLATLEYRLPLIDVFHGISTLPVFLSRMKLALYADFAQSNDDPLGLPQWDDSKKSLGMELVIQGIVAWRRELSSRIGMAKGLGGDFQIYYNLGTWF